ncbi:uncharacterized protein LOC131164456 isoform X2 [Malania oleifera]|uniref:uncharacterized protein LOC131164456 isoform X2 n=1 Tax=Malania oleifera TaxID=397392 RepID=UPI0025ADBDB2|nr:uncharacterized protein LOC131164456 isoform X2 [Malania oleifera]
MGKVEEQHLREQQIQGTRPRTRSSGIFCERCSMGLSRIAGEFNFKCIVILVLGLVVLLSAIFWILPPQARQSGFDAKEAIKLSATVQAYFKLQRPASRLVQRIGRLEYDIFEEIGLPETKVVVLSMHQGSDPNYTDVVFGVLSDPMNASINPVPLSVLRSSLVDVFLQQFNLTLTTSVFGKLSSFEILKFPGGITIIPEPYASFWQIPQILFNFTLNNSVSDIRKNFSALKEQLKFGLRLKSYENVYIQVTNKDGSTRNPPVTVQASVTSDLGSLPPQRLKQLAQIIEGSPSAENLGLDNSVFGKVKEISLSSYLNLTLNSTPSTPPIPSPAPSPDLSPSYSPIPSPCFKCKTAYPNPKSGAYYSLPPISTSTPSGVTAHPPCPCPYGGLSPSSSTGSQSESPIPSAISFSVPSPYSPLMAPTSKLSPDLSPAPVVSYGSGPGHEKGSRKGSKYRISSCSSYKKTRLLVLPALFVIFPILCW